MNFSIAQRHARVLVIDAIRHPEGWQWNSWYNDGSVPESVCDLKPRALLRELRRRGLLNRWSAGKMAVEDDGYNVVVLRRSNRQPVIALEYGCLIDNPQPSKRKPLITSEIVCHDLHGGFHGAILNSSEKWEVSTIYLEAAEVIHQHTGNGEAACCEMLDSAWGANFAAAFLEQRIDLNYEEALEAAYKSLPVQI